MQEQKITLIKAVKLLCDKDRNKDLIKYLKRELRRKGLRHAEYNESAQYEFLCGKNNNVIVAFTWDNISAFNVVTQEYTDLITNIHKVAEVFEK